MVTPLENSLNILLRHNDPEKMSFVLSNLSNLAMSRGNIIEAEHYAKKLLLIAENNQNKISAMNRYSQILRAKKDYEGALLYLKKTIKMMEYGNFSKKDEIYYNIATIYLELEVYEKAKKYQELSYQIAKNTSNKKLLSYILNDISVLSMKKSEYSIAIKYLKESNTIKDEINDQEGKCSSLYNLGYAYWRNNEIENAADSWVKSYRLAKEIGYSKTLKSLENIAPKIGLAGGLAGWETLSKRLE